MKSNVLGKVIVIAIVVITIGIITVMYIKESNIEFDFREVQEVSFLQLNNMNDIKELKGKKIRILGYISPNSPYGTSYIYLCTKPYSTEVFKEDTFNTIAVHSKDGKAISYSIYPVYVTGKLVTGNFKDAQGYSYKYRIENAEIVNATIEQVNGLTEKYLILAQDNVLNRLNNIFGQIDMLVYYNEYKEMDYLHEDDLTNIDITAIDMLMQQVKQYEDETYTTIIEVLEQLKTVSEDLNKLLDKKQYDKLVEKTEAFEKAYYEFYYYIAEFGI